MTEEETEKFVQEIVAANPQCAEQKTAELFPAFVRETVDTIAFLKAQGITCDFWPLHNTFHGWSVAMFPNTPNPDDEFVVQKSPRDPQGEFEVMRDNAVQRDACTPPGLLQFAHKIILGTPKL